MPPKPRPTVDFDTWLGGQHVRHNVTLNRQQRDALRFLHAGHNVFLTGAGGTGKSAVISFARTLLGEMHGEHTVFVTASTGIAAYHIKGTTVHRFAAIGDATRTPQHYATEILKRGPEKWRTTLFKRIRGARALILDEVSMLSAETLDVLDETLRLVRGLPAVAFGGIQVLIVGDFYQLPPVSRPDRPAHFAFDARAWRDANLLTVELVENFRQQQDAEFLELLGNLRIGRNVGEVIAKLQTRSFPAPLPHAPAVAGAPPPPTRLRPHKVDVDRENREGLYLLPGPSEVYTADDFGDIREEEVRAPKVLELRVGALVMATRNTKEDDGALVNGMRGVVTAFEGGTVRYPVVEFEDDRTITVKPVRFEKHDSEGIVRSSRAQLPLLLAYASTIHAAQGQTLSSVEIAVKNLFGPHMAYVALSRARSLAGVRLVGALSPGTIFIAPEVRAFHAAMARASVEDAVAPRPTPTGTTPAKRAAPVSRNTPASRIRAKMQAAAAPAAAAGAE